MKESQLDRIFVSYRPADSADICGRIYDRLVARFGREQVSKDVGPPSGVSFERHIADVLEHCAVQLVVIGPRWLTIASARGRRRLLDDPRDTVRLEIEAALRQGIPVIPLLVQGAQVPDPRKLPPSLRELPGRNGIVIRPDPEFEPGMARVLAAVERWLARPREQAPAVPAPAAQPAARPGGLARPTAAAGDPQPARAQPKPARAQPRVLLAAAALLVAVAISVLLGIHARGTLTPQESSATRTVATAQASLRDLTATTTAFWSKPHVAAVPGPCGADAAEWGQLIGDDPTPAAVSCTSGSMHLVGSGHTVFHDRRLTDHAGAAFPPQYSVGVEARLGGDNTCAYLEPLLLYDVAGQLSVCSGGVWQIAITGQAQTQSLQGQIANPPVSSTLLITLQYGFETFSVDGKQVYALAVVGGGDVTLGIALGTNPPGSATSADFSGFTFTPLH